MPVVTEAELPEWDYTDETITGPRFHEVMLGLAERSWIARADPVGWIVLDHEAVAFFMRTPQANFPGILMLEVQGVTEGPMWERMKGNLLDLRGEDHRRQRKLVQHAFTPKEADKLRPLMRQELEKLWDAVADDGRCDFVDAFAKPYPARMIAGVMGSPLEDAPQLGHWANLIQKQFDPVAIATMLPTLEQASSEFVDYVNDLIAKRKGDPRDDLITYLIEAEEDGDRLTEEEMNHLVSAVLVGGVDTTQAQLAHGIRLFAAHPDQWELLRRNPEELAVAAAEEVLRYEPITALTARITLEDVEYRGIEFPANTVVLACALTANHDPEAYDRAEDFDITADRGRAKPLTFGAGPHFCLGANLARAELQEAFRFLAERIETVEPAGEPVYDTPLGVHGLHELPISFARA
ncbi:MAG TPA: cytochrome P450 [Thermoleophilaceae bacterium]|nr:cytochrome P450 [Thermoleophilaceae bacterium]